jgi:hypothetical protein
VKAFKIFNSFRLAFGANWYLGCFGENHMAEPNEPKASLLQAIERIETALTLVDETTYPTSAFLIERALDQMRADAWPDAIDDAPAAH